MAAHALLSASSMHRWENCTRAPRFEAQFPQGEASVYAQEGTLAHKMCEEVQIITSTRLISVPSIAG